MNGPRVSVIIDTYNHEKFIERAIASVFEQDFRSGGVEIVVVDDGSTDRTSEILRKFDYKLRVIRKPNGGQASAFNVAIPQTRANIVAFLDGDDWWEKTKLSAVLSTFEKNPDIAAVGHGYYEVVGDDRPAEMVVANTTCFVDISSPKAAAVANLGRTMLATSRLAVRRRVLDRIGELPESLVFCADGPILTASLALGGAVILERPLCYYRLHSGSLFTHSSDDSSKAIRKAEMLALLVEYLRPLLTELGVGGEAAESVLECYRLEIDRLRLFSGERGRWKSLNVEIREARSSFRNASLPYFAFKSLVGALAFALPGQQFYAIRRWYDRKNLKRFRDKLAPAAPADSQSLFQRRPVTRTD
jgi:glycosyltransferase involved in cell wall biosynthesis